MKIDILTLFPEMFEGFLNESIIKKAIEEEKVEINIHNIRDYSKDKHKRVDDYPFGGGSGMVLMCQPIFDAIEDLKSKKSKVIMMTPQGETYTQKKALELKEEKHLILLCGHYEGFDERIKTVVDEEISIGDYILTGGELPAMVITDSITRLIDGVIKEESAEKESFSNDKLDFPSYTKPREYKGMKVPEVLLSGDHKKIDEYREAEAIKNTIEKRPDLLRVETKKEFSDSILFSKYTVKATDKEIEYSNLEINLGLKRKFPEKNAYNLKELTLISPELINAFHEKRRKLQEQEEPVAPNQAPKTLKRDLEFEDIIRKFNSGLPLTEEEKKQIDIYIRRNEYKELAKQDLEEKMQVGRRAR